MNHKTLLIIGAIIVLLLLIWVNPFNLSLGRYYTITADPVVVHSDGEHPANNRQHEASVWMDAYDGKLYFYLDDDLIPMIIRSGLRGRLLSFEDGTVRKSEDIIGEKARAMYVLGSGDSKVYCGLRADNWYALDIYRYDLKTGSQTLLYTDASIVHETSRYCADGSAWFFLLHNNDQHLHVSESGDSELCAMTEGYPLGSYTYQLSFDLDCADIVRIDENGNAENLSLGLADYRSIIPCDNGLLIHNEGYGNLLYWIDPEGNITELFNAECMDSQSAVTVCGSDIYLSFMRYEHFDTWGNYIPYADDSLPGTYRISLIDSSAVKISDKVYNGLYNFDDTCLYACDKFGNVYQLDLEGYEIRTLLKIKSK